MITKEIKVKEIISKSNLPVGEYSANTYVGCEHDCKYCYASFMKRFTGHEESWGQFVDVKYWDKIKKSYRYVDIVFGTHTMQDLPKDVYKVIKDRKKVTDVIDIDGKVIEGLPIRRNDKYRAGVSIMYGCNNFCTYCIVPYVRRKRKK